MLISDDLLIDSIDSHVDPFRVAQLRINITESQDRPVPLPELDLSPHHGDLHPGSRGVGGQGGGLFDPDAGAHDAGVGEAGAG